jgi:hypothetical protein
MGKGEPGESVCSGLGTATLVDPCYGPFRWLETAQEEDAPDFASGLEV